MKAPLVGFNTDIACSYGSHIQCTSHQNVMYGLMLAVAGRREPPGIQRCAFAAGVLLRARAVVWQTLLLATLISAAFAWQTGQEFSGSQFQLAGGLCAAAVLLWVCLRTATRFSTVNARTALALTAV